MKKRFKLILRYLIILKNNFIDNPVETEDADPKAFGLKYPRVNTSGSRFICEMMV